ncbi:MAG: 2,3-bisphosphoglycerate-independent phosphoglycerate mutase [Candidatus Heimdallarchaeota archaeon]|nr:2,3-bisphosphoglycerate-independent phosphoglycerate mutase [Candidatus Heimdallarchaeota archaeon]
MYHLNKLKDFSGREGPLLLIIMDGIGIGEENDGNAVYLANPSTLNQLEKECKEKNLFCKLKAHGSAVGLLSEKDMGNSEVGHNALGGGKIYEQGAKRADSAIKTGEIFRSDLWKRLTAKIIQHDNTAHLLGLVSDGNVHSNLDQLFGLIDGLAETGVQKVRIHALTDGRDVPSHSALNYIRPLKEKLVKIMESHSSDNFDYRIASGGGRMIVTMDRYESDWRIVQRGWDAHVRGVVREDDLTDCYQGNYPSAEEAIKKARECFPERTDQTLPPFVIVDENGDPVGKITDGDLVINFNFRGDRAIEISRTFEEKNFSEFDRVVWPEVDYVGLTQYDGDKEIPKKYLVSPPEIEDVLSDYCCANDITSFAIAETHKFGHITYFWNGNNSGYICPEKEVYVEVKSEPNEMIPEHPEMKAVEVCDETIKALKSQKYQFVRVNFANGDMVGHTGLLDAAITAVKTVDTCVKRLVEVVNSLNGITIITADHGNCEEMKLPDGSAKTAHSLNPVCFLIVDKNWSHEYEINQRVEDPGLSNIAATVLNLLGFEKPEDYRESLVSFNS